MLSIKTLMGNKICSPEEALRLKTIIVEVAVADELFWEHPLADEILAAFPDVNIPDLPPVRETKFSSKMNDNLGQGFFLKKHKMNEHWLRKLNIACPYCRGYANHDYCSVNNRCIHTEFFLKEMNSENPSSITVRQAFLRTTTRQPTACIFPHQIKNGNRNWRYNDDFYKFIINGIIIDVEYTQEYSLVDSISNNMYFPWNNPYISSAEKFAWAHIKELRELYRNRPAHKKHSGVTYFIRKLNKSIPSSGNVGTFFNSLVEFVKEDFPDIFEESLAAFDPELPEELSWKHTLPRHGKRYVING